jgi:hypothetical protein
MKRNESLARGKYLRRVSRVSTHTLTEDPTRLLKQISIEGGEEFSVTVPRLSYVYIRAFLYSYMHLLARHSSAAPFVVSFIKRFFSLSHSNRSPFGFISRTFNCLIVLHDVAEIIPSDFLFSSSLQLVSFP